MFVVCSVYVVSVDVMNMRDFLKNCRVFTENQEINDSENKIFVLLFFFSSITVPQYLSDLSISI